MDQKIRVAGCVAAVAIIGYICLPSLSQAPSKRLSKYTTGLINTGNDCYANSVFQALASLPSFEKWLRGQTSCIRQMQKEEGGAEEEKEVLEQGEIERLGSREGNSAARKDAEKGYKETDVSESEGVQEDKPQQTRPWTSALLETLSIIRLEHSYPKKISIWPLLRIMEALTNSRISRAQQDAHEMLVYTLDILQTEASAGLSPQEKATDSFLFTITTEDKIICHKCRFAKTSRHRTLVLERQPGESIGGTQREYIDGYNCKQCGPTRITKTCQITELQSVLVVHVNRSTVDGQRNNQATAVPLTLGAFRIKAVVFHTGTHSRGHYTCARRKHYSNNAKKWWIISDDYIVEASDHDIRRRTQDAYLLFYERQTADQPNTHVVPSA